MIRVFVVLSTLAAAGAAPAFASESTAPVAQPDISDILIACASKLNDRERLACYDTEIISLSAEASRLAQARSAQAEALAAAEKVQTAEARRAEFGAETLSVELRPTDPDRIEQINSRVAEILQSRAKQPVWLLENGQLWRHVDGDATFNVRVGEAVRLERGAVGSYRMFFEKSRRAVGVRRLR